MSQIPRRQQFMDKKGELDGDRTYQELCDSGTICETLNGLYLKSNRHLDNSLRELKELATENIERFSNRGY